MKTYEAMFLLDAGNPDFEEAATPVRELLKRAEAETLSLKPWDERRLAYEIKGRRRGLYVLTYFKADPARLEAMEHDIQLDERILRAMILSADHVDEKVVQAETPATQAQSRKAAREAEEAAKEKPEEKAKEKPEEKAKEEPEEKAKEKSEEKREARRRRGARPRRSAGGGGAQAARPGYRHGAGRTRRLIRQPRRPHTETASESENAPWPTTTR